MKKAAFLALSVLSFALSGCADFAEKTNTLTDEEILSKSASTLRYAPKDLSIVSRRTSGTITYVNLVGVKDKQEYNCTINSGELWAHMIRAVCSKILKY